MLQTMVSPSSNQNAVPVTGAYKVDISRGERIGGCRPSGSPGLTTNATCH